MPKIKTNRGAAKRLKRTGSGKLKRHRAFGNHILTKKSPKQKQRLATSVLVAKCDQPAMDRLIPYK